MVAINLLPNNNRIPTFRPGIMRGVLIVTFEIMIMWNRSWNILILSSSIIFWRLNKVIGIGGGSSQNMPEALRSRKFCSKIENRKSKRNWAGDYILQRNHYCFNIFPSRHSEFSGPDTILLFGLRSTTSTVECPRKAIFARNQM